MAFYFNFNKATVDDSKIKNYKYTYSKTKVASVASQQQQSINEMANTIREEKQREQESLLENWTPSQSGTTVEEIKNSTDTKLAVVTIRGHKFIADNLLNTIEYHTGICLHKYGKIWYLLKNLCPIKPTPGQDPHPGQGEQDPEFQGWEAEFITTPAAAEFNYSTLEGINLDDITDETANGGDNWDGSNRQVVLYFVGCINKDGSEKRLEEPYMMDWCDEAGQQNTDMQEYLKLKGFNPYQNAPGACYNIDTDATSVITATYDQPLIFKLAYVKDPVNNVSVTG